VGLTDPVALLETDGVVDVLVDGDEDVLAVSLDV
jgi:hypothetical protein